MLRRVLFLTLLCACILLAARLSRIHDIQWDISRNQHNTLSKASQQILGTIEGSIAITAYAPEYPVLRARIRHQVMRFQRQHAALSLTFIDPLQHPGQSERLGIRQHGELLIEANGRSEHVRQLDESGIAQALSRLALRGEHWIVNLRGHGESELHDNDHNGLSAFATRLQQQGYKTIDLDPLQTSSIPDNTALLVSAGAVHDYPPTVTRQIQKYLQQGGRLLWLAEHQLPAKLAPGLESGLLPGVIVDAAAAAKGYSSPAHAILNEFPQQLLNQIPGQAAILPGAHGLRVAAREDWKVNARLRTGASSWNETGPVKGRIRQDANAGEHAGPLSAIIALSNQHNRIVISGDRDFLNNQYLGRGGNQALALGLVHWLTDNSALPNQTHAFDQHINWSTKLAATIAGLAMIGLPLLYISLGLLIRWRRQR